MTADQGIRWVAKPTVFALCLTPVAWHVWLLFTGGLGANPIEATNRFCGEWALRFLLIALAVTPARELFGWSALARFRRMMGLFAFFYVFLHLSSYVVLDQFFHWPSIWEDIVKRNYITVGMVSFVLLLPLAVTSTKGWVKRLGGRAWKRLHRLVFPAAVLAVVHFYMMVRVDTREPLIYGAILALLLAVRSIGPLRRRLSRRRRKPAERPAVV